ncbi:MAG: response regulator [Candidatus Dormibacteraeota bacterium]|nr:response regulator [Candidatus Dormibacteraeota bacterium]MBV9526521.1 response regulator [Candidatus Dormibacteraeota bacterium]
METTEQAIDVLLIEDDEQFLDMYRLRLERDGYRVHTATDGERGLTAAGELHPDIIFLDIRLPKVDGFEVLRRLREDPATSHVPVVILSNYGEEEMRDRGHEMGALEFLVKAHTTPVELSEGIEEWLKE